MKKLIGKFVLFIFGWKADFPIKFKINRTVMLAAPHTSNWDLLFALAVYWKEGVPVKFLIKNDYTKGIHGYFFRWLGALGVDRKKNTNMVDYTASLFEGSEKLVLMVPAEGTRKWVEKWKTGFYHIAMKANVPVSLGFLDYQEKIAGVGMNYNLTGVFKDDMDVIQGFYKNKIAKHPDNYNPKIY